MTSWILIVYTIVAVITFTFVVIMQRLGALTRREAERVLLPVTFGWPVMVMGALILAASVVFAWPEDG